MEKAFKNLIKSEFPYLSQAKILLAVSGGVDSAVLAHLCKSAKLNFTLAHCNFKLRGEESDADEKFVADLANALEVEVFTQSFDTQKYAKEKKLSIQMAARELRYRWFEELAGNYDFDYIFTAHHANDNLETFLINLLRGTGLEGLTGIPRVNGNTIRPLLSFSRKKIKNFAEENGISWREDSSNASTKYLRNKLRLDIVPVMEDLNPQLLQAFEKTQLHLQEAANLVEDYVGLLYQEIVRKNEFGYELNIEFIQKTPHSRAVLYHLLKSFGFTEWNDVYDLMQAQTGKMVFSNTHRLIRDRENLLLTEIPEDTSDLSYKVAENEDVVMLPIGSLTFEKVDAIEETGPDRIYVSGEKLDFPLRLRKWKEGDYFYPFGMKGKKKISDFFKDKKLSLPEKENCWILCSAEKIVWVINYRADDRFAVKSASREIIKITYSP